jgi:hypothetical protein
MSRIFLNGLSLVEAEYYRKILEEAGIESAIEECGLAGPFDENYAAGSRDTLSGGFRLSVSEKDESEALELIEPLLRKTGQRT